jgi:hypothetical protein
MADSIEATSSRDGDNAPEQSWLLGFAGEAITILVLGIPAIGVLIRWISLVSFEGPRLRIATSAPLAELAGTTVAASWQMALIAAGIFGFTHFVGGSAATSTSTSSNARGWRYFRLFQIGTIGLVVIWSLAFAPSFPSLPIMAVSGILLGITVRRAADPRPLRIGNFAMPALIVLVGSVAFYATRPSGADVPAAHVEFAEGSGLADGDYLDLGTSDGIQFLIPCGSQQIVSVPVGSSVRMEYFGRDVPPSPSLKDAITGDGLEIGLSSAC